MTVSAPARRATWQDAYAAQMGLWRWTRAGSPGEKYLIAGYQHEARGLEEGTQDMLLKLYGAENRKLFDADPIFVSSEMCDVVSAARHSFELEPLLPTDLLTAHGFMYYEDPIEILDKRGEATLVGAISWTPVLGSIDRAKSIPDGASLLDYFQGRDYTELWAGDVRDDETAGAIDGIAITIYSPTAPDSWAAEHGAPSVVPIHLTPWWFGMTFEGNETDQADMPTGAQWWWRLAQTTLRLMQQTLSTRSRYKLDRPTRREAKRREFVEREVLVVRLRREHNQNPDAPQHDANYSHRFIVGGHWRNQWYPASNVHRQIYISPYLKGPEDAPLLIKPRRVFAWVR